jgi:pilin isopeptide linkage protein
VIESGSSSTRVPLGGYYTTDATGRIEVEGLPSGQFVFVEVEPAFGYDFDQDRQGKDITEYPFALPFTSGNAEITVFNRMVTAALTVSKTVMNEDASLISPTQLLKDFTFTFTIDPASSFVVIDSQATYSAEIVDTLTADNPVVSSITLKSGSTFKLRHGQQVRINGIPVGAAYEIDEVPVLGYFTSSTNAQGTMTDKGAQVTYTNTRSSRDMGTLTIKKLVEGDQSSRDHEFTYEVSIDNSLVPQFKPSTLMWTRTRSSELPGGEPGKPVAESSVTEFIETSTYKVMLKAKAGDVIVFDDLPLGLKYTVKEVNTLDYTASPIDVSGIIQSPGGVTIPFVNFKGTPISDTWKLDITKRLRDYSSDKKADKDKEFEFTLTFSETALMPGYATGTIECIITRAGGGTESVPVPQGTGRVTVKLKADDKMSIVGVGTDRIIYGIAEKDYSSEYYYSSYSTMAGTIRDGQTIDLNWDNHFNPEEISRDTLLRVRKTVKGEAPDTHHLFVFELTIDDQKPEIFTLTATETATFDTQVGSRYRIKEILDPADGYILTGVINGQGTVTDDVLIEGVTFTNTYIRPLTRNIEGQKSWDLRGITGIVLPERVEVQLVDTRDDSVIRQQTVTAASEWLFSFNEVDATDENGRPVPYTVEEVPIPNYSSSVSQGPTGYFTLTNVYLPPVVVDTPFVMKKVAPSSAPEESFAFTLRPQGKAPLPRGSSPTESTISIKGSGVTQFNTITFTDPGVYVYHIAEVAGSASGFTYDKTVYRLEYVVTKIETDLGYALEPQASLTRLSDGKEVTSAEFVNKYEKLPGAGDGSGSKNINAVKTGDTTNVMFWIIWLIVAAGTVSFAILVRQRTEKSRGN